ncbi:MULTISPECIES: DUF1707 SHOCT-like domain-containing protein [unclassified Micromonospora]|uniref:DUF1707 SHOCT-like domain-containing protein n=1 Tax=unclassified Micromonospora TaxID=2617518 RepID=UPI0022C9D926|nr:DUF1707 domain-containing protein [Micromonospora sp. AKA38]GHJ14860.1 hypothetical protein TPA0908_28550 [Micromonospora sp. AKA38]
MDGHREMRAADRDREAVAERLRVALEEGRLGLHEYDERLARAYGARTYGELDEVVADLPGPAPVERSALAPAAPNPPPAPVAPSDPVAGAHEVPENRSRLLGLWLPWLRVAAILVPIWLIGAVASGHAAGVWPLWVLGPWGGLVLMQSVGLIGADHGRKRRDRRR